MGFPKNFDFGVASSAYQVEGAWNANGKGASIWDTYAAVPGNIADGTTGKVGCDHYHHYLEDIALMKEMGEWIVIAFPSPGRESIRRGLGC